MAELTQQQRRGVETEIFAGNRIAAIKLYRETTGMGLAEAKQAIEKMESNLRTAHPQKFTASGARTGCGAPTMAMMVPVAVVVWLVSKATG